MLQRLPPRPLIAGIALAVFLLLLTAATAHAQPTAAVTIGGSFDAFQPVITGSESRQNVIGALNAEHLFDEERARVFYDLAAGNYDSPGDWRFFQHDLGFTYRFGSGETNGRKAYLNGSVVIRSNGDAWVNAAYTAVGGGLNAEFHPRETTTIRTGYRADYRRFADLDALTQLEHRAFASLLTSFPTRTTVVAEVQVGTKHYDGVTMTELVDSALPGATLGRGNVQGLGPGIRWTTAGPSFVSSTQEGAAGLATVLGRVAQSLTDRTGLHAQVLLRRTFGSVPPALVATPAGFFEDGVYDDPFASTATILQAGTKHVFAGSAEVAATGWWTSKDYTSATAIDANGSALAGSPMRTDTVSIGNVTWSQPLFRSRTGAIGLSGDLGYRFNRHRSNDAFYNYTSHAVTVGFAIEY